MERKLLPLAFRARPKELSDVVGQRHILGEGKVLTRMIEKGDAANMIFYGPSGTGKTTVANIIAERAEKRLYKLNATTASIADIKGIIDEVDTLLAPRGILLYLDEIQYFNKKQQQSLLEFIENGKITMIASTTENPYFYIYNAILSRCTVFEFFPLQEGDIMRALERAVALEERDLETRIRAEEEVLRFLAVSCGGDVRKALNALELMILSADVAPDGAYLLTMESAQLLTRRSGMRHDRDGDDHFDVLSAFHKSLRGSDVDAALHYLARLIEAGDLPSLYRRLLACASEDVGLAYPQLAMIVKACVDSAMQLGLPEARLPLAQAAMLIATAPKSNSVLAVDAALADVRQGKGGKIPPHLRDASYAGAEKLGRGTEYRYPHSFKDHWVRQQYLPDSLKDAVYYKPGSNKSEQAIAEYWEKVKKGK